MGWQEEEHLADQDFESIPERIKGFQRLEEFYEFHGYLICQSCGKKIYDLEKVVAVYIPLSSTLEQVVPVHTDYAAEFMQNSLRWLKGVAQ